MRLSFAYMSIFFLCLIMLPVLSLGQESPKPQIIKKCFLESDYVKLQDDHSRKLLENGKRDLNSSSTLKAVEEFNRDLRKIFSKYYLIIDKIKDCPADMAFFQPE